MNRKVSARAIIIKDGQLFCVRLKDYEGKTWVPLDFWCTPGGGLDIGENLAAGLERELIEELGVKPVIGDLLFVQQFQPRKGSEQLEFFFHITNADDFLDIDLSKTTHGDAEIAEYGFINPGAYTILPAFLKDQDFSAIKLSGNATKIFSLLN